jgi:DNA end-binding protein Ku
MDQMSEDFEVSSLHDEYREAVDAMVESKLHGGTAASPKPAAASNVIDINELLQRSIDAQKARHRETPKPAAKKTAAKAPTRKTTAKKIGAARGGTTAKKTPAKRASTRKAG